MSGTKHCVVPRGLDSPTFSLPGTPVPGSRLCRAYGAPSFVIGIPIPGLPAWADVWTNGPLGLDDGIDWTFVLAQISKTLICVEQADRGLILRRPIRMFAVLKVLDPCDA
jgi:hypothetical protein